MIRKTWHILKKIKLRTIIILIVLLLFNSYAWFIFATKVSTSFTAHVTSWNVEFQTDGEAVTNMSFEVERMYPGMENYTQSVVAHNRGELRANLSYEIDSVKIFDTLYEKDENTTSEDLVGMIENDFPFHITINIQDENLIAGNGEGSVIISLEWPFESGNDTSDTYWGEEAYRYYSIHPGESSIVIELQIKAIQQQS